MSFLTSSPVELAETAAKAALMYAVAVIGLRLSERRTLAQWSSVDFVAAVAVGAVVGRTAVAPMQSFATGAIALVVLLVLHRLLSLARFRPRIAELIDHRVRALVRDGQVQRHELRLCGLTDDDLAAQLRQRGVLTLAGIRYVLYESKGGLTVVPDETPPATELLDAAVGRASHRGPAIE